MSESLSQRFAGVVIDYERRGSASDAKLFNELSEKIDALEKERAIFQDTVKKLVALERDANVVSAKLWRDQYEQSQGDLLLARIENQRLRAAVRDAIIEIDEARDYVEGTDLARETLVRALANTEGEP